MRLRWFAPVAVVLLLAGCNSGVDPAAERGSSTGAESNSADPDDKNSDGETTTVVIPPPADDPHHGHHHGDAGGELGNEVNLAAMTLTAPDAWQRKQPSSSFVEAEFVLPVTEENENAARLTVSIAGGSIEANIQRWKGQFGGKPEKESQEEVEVDGIKATMVDFTGDFDDRRGPFAPGEKRSGYRMIAAIIPIDGQLHFVKATGPQETVAAHAEAIEEFVRSVKKKQ